MTLVWASNLLLAIVAAAGFGVIILRLRRLEGRQKRWVQSLSTLIVTTTAADSVRSLLATPRYGDPRHLARFGGKIYSQGDEDGIIEEIFSRVGTSSRRFLEIGAGDGLENNTLALLVKGWTGSWIDGSPRNAARVRQRYASMLKDGRLRFFDRYVSRETLPALVAELGDVENLDLLSLDIDGNDYHILERLPLKARVIAVEYNARFAPPVDWVMAYNPGHIWDGTDNFGASLSAFARLLAARGYSLVGCNITGVNAFFVRNDLLGDSLFLGPHTAAMHYEPARYWLIAGFNPAHRANFHPGERRAD